MSREFATIYNNLWHFLSRPLPPVPFWISPDSDLSPCNIHFHPTQALSAGSPTTLFTWWKCIQILLWPMLAELGAKIALNMWVAVLNWSSAMQRSFKLVIEVVQMEVGTEEDKGRASPSASRVAHGNSSTVSEAASWEVPRPCGAIEAA